MKSFLANSNIVVVANQFNPSVINQLWLVDFGIVHREEFLPGCVFTDMMVNVLSEKFSLLVVPEQLQFVPLVESCDQQSLIESRLGGIIRTIPHTPYAACGMNFTWFVEPDDLPDFARKLFFVDRSPIHRQFDTVDSRFGGYMSKSVLGGRLKLDVKPLTTKQSDGSAMELMQFGFNFHYEVTDPQKTSDELLRILSFWDAALKLVESSMKTVEEVLECPK